MTDTVTVPREVLERIESHCERLESDGSHSVTHGTPSFSNVRYYNYNLARDLRSLLAAAPKAEPASDPYKLGDGEVLQWVDGYPEKFRSGEWFIALTSFGDRVCLKALPEEYSYEFTTADGTYIKAEKIAKWMPFPDSEFRHPAQPEAPKVEQEPVAYVGAEELHDIRNGFVTVTATLWATRVDGTYPIFTHPAPASDELQSFADFIADEVHNLDLTKKQLEIVKAAFRAVIGRYNAKHKGPQS